MPDVQEPEGGERVHPAGQPGRDPREPAAAEHPADRERARHERGEEQEVVAGDGVGHDLQEQEELRRRPQEMVGVRQRAPRGIVEVGVPDVRKPKPDLMGPPLEHVEVEQGIAEARPDVIPRKARQRPEVDEREGRVESGKGQPRQEAAGGRGRGHEAGLYRTPHPSLTDPTDPSDPSDQTDGAGLYSAARGLIPGRAYAAAPFPELPF